MVYDPVFVTYKVSATEKELEPVLRSADCVELKIRVENAELAGIVAIVLVVPVRLQREPEFQVAVGIVPPLAL
jgi:hypothetical protein